MPGRGGGTGGAARTRTALLTSLVVLSCCHGTVAFVGGLSPAPKTARLVALSPAPKTDRLVSSALAPPSRHVLIFSTMLMMSTPPTPRGPAGPRETTPPHGSAPPVQALVARALQKSMVNQTTLALTAMAPKRSAPVPLKVYQASFVVKVRVVPAQPALSCASPLPELSLRPCPSVWAAAEQGKTAALQPAVLYGVVCCCEMLCMDGVH